VLTEPVQEAVTCKGVLTEPVQEAVTCKCVLTEPVQEAVTCKGVLTEPVQEAVTCATLAQKLCQGFLGASGTMLNGSIVAGADAWTRDSSCAILT
jgi:hypothetical protein